MFLILVLVKSCHATSYSVTSCALLYCRVPMLATFFLVRLLSSQGVGATHRARESGGSTLKPHHAEEPGPAVQPSLPRFPASTFLWQAVSGRLLDLSCSPQVGIRNMRGRAVDYFHLGNRGRLRCLRSVFLYCHLSPVFHVSFQSTLRTRTSFMINSLGGSLVPSQAISGLWALFIVPC